MVFHISVVEKCVAVIMFIIVTGVNCNCSTDNQNLTAETKLKNHLLCNYDPESIPVKDHKKTIRVEVYLLPVYITAEGEDNKITLHSWIYQTWSDEYLKWNKSEHSNIEELSIWSYRIWVPKIYAFSNGPVSNSADLTECSLVEAGEVACLVHVSYMSVCEAHIRHWPFDWQNCTLTLRTWMYQGEHINLTIMDFSEGYSMHNYKPNPHWKLFNISVTRKANGIPELNVTFPFIKVTLLMSRHSASHAATVVAPALVFIVTTLITITMRMDSFERIYLLFVNIFCHFVYLTEMISWKIPSIGTEYPLMAAFFRDSTVICVIILIATIAMRKNLNKKMMVPKWVDLVLDLSQTKVLSWIMYATQDQNEISAIMGDSLSEVAARVDQRNNQEWNYFATFVNRCLFLATFLVYFGMFLAFCTEYFIFYPASTQDGYFGDSNSFS